jgi:hypothetical protein
MSNHTRPASPVAFELPNMTLHGFTGTLILTGETGADLAATLKAMLAAGMTQAAVPVAPAAHAAPTAVPVCPTHGKPMKESRKPGAWFCSAKVGEGYCDYKVSQ